MAQLVERLDLDLADALAGDPKPLTDLFERALAAVADAEPHLDENRLANSEQRIPYDAAQVGYERPT